MLRGFMVLDSDNVALTIGVLYERDLEMRPSREAREWILRNHAGVTDIDAVDDLVVLTFPVTVHNAP